jgi:hypothetical protein
MTVIKKRSLRCWYRSSSRKLPFYIDNQPADALTSFSRKVSRWSSVRFYYLKGLITLWKLLYKTVIVWDNLVPPRGPETAEVTSFFYQLLRFFSHEVGVPFEIKRRSEQDGGIKYQCESCLVLPPRAAPWAPRDDNSFSMAFHFKSLALN